MMVRAILSHLIAPRWQPGRDLLAVLISWLLVTGALAGATLVITAENGVGYFLAYGIVAAGLIGIGIPLL